MSCHSPSLKQRHNESYVVKKWKLLPREHRYKAKKSATKSLSPYFLKKLYERRFCCAVNILQNITNFDKSIDFLVSVWYNLYVSL